MKSTSTFVLLSSLLSTALLTGCSGFTGAGFPDVPTQTQMAPLQGSNFGGHAPVVGAHVFVLEATTTGYAAKAKSLLSATYPTGSAYPTALDSTGGATNGLYYVTTDNAGVFNISGDYSCDAGYPIYLYGAGGSPTTVSPVAITASAATQTGGSLVLGYVYSISFTAPNLFYTGQTVTLSGLTGGYAALNGNQVVASESTTGFTVNFTGGLLVPLITGTSTGTVTPIAPPNPAIVNIAMLGLCPSSGNFTGAITYIYMNEVSTAAAMYAMAGFASDSLHIGSSSTNLLGLQHAAVNAGQLYDIQGSNPSTTYDGEGHIARPNTPAGNGVVTQTTLDSLGNILAACVDSANTYDPVAATGTKSPTCTTLFANATLNGQTSGTKAIDTATAVLNIAHFPAGVGNANFVSNLYGLPTGVAPFTPLLAAQPNDFTVAIQYPNSLNPAVNGPESIGIDSNGNVWMNSLNADNLFVMSPTGVVTFNGPSQGYRVGYLSVDPSNNVWIGNNEGQSYEREFNSAGTLLSGTGFGPGFYDAYITVTDSSGNAYAAATTSSASAQMQMYKFTSAGASVTGSPFNISASVPSGYNVAHGAVENASTGGDIWWTTEQGSAGNVYRITRVSATTGAAATGFPVTTGLNSPEMPGIDASSNLWVANQGSNVMMKVATDGTVTNPTGGTLNRPFGTAIDGNGNVFVAQRGNNTIVEYNGATSAAISPTTNYALQGLITAPLNLQIDSAGTVWMTSYDNSLVVELIGTAAPAMTPLSAAAGANKLGTKP